MKTIKITVPEEYCMEPGGAQCSFLYNTGVKFRCRAFDLSGGWLHRDEDCRTHKCKECINAETT
jgi:hypothetical protein